ncbi:MAG TPA: cyclic nucleotide-binding domain-containing protein [Verrucomicrobiae bacterium]|nr:cyclic nucleotide-binding domain-containing protein [Verrucomicrobiae bacterium]
MNESIKATRELAETKTPICASTAGVETLLRQHPFLKGLTPHQIRLLTDCAMVTHFSPGELIFREGDPANRFYLIHEGKVALESPGGENGSIFIQNVGAGEVLGWSWLFPPYYWHFDARAIEPTQAVFLYGTPLREECETDHDLGYELVMRMAEVMMKRLQATRRQLLDLKGDAGKNRCSPEAGSGDARQHIASASSIPQKIVSTS